MRSLTTAALSRARHIKIVGIFQSPLLYELRHGSRGYFSRCTLRVRHAQTEVAPIDANPIARLVQTRLLLRPQVQHSQGARAGPPPRYLLRISIDCNLRADIEKELHLVRRIVRRPRRPAEISDGP